jgi:hypothetical protein
MKTFRRRGDFLCFCYRYGSGEMMLRDTVVESKFGLSLSLASLSLDPVLSGVFYFI